MILYETPDGNYRDDGGHAWETHGRLLIPVEDDQPLLIVADVTEWPAEAGTVSARQLDEGTLIVCRGLPGSGREQEAKALAGALEAPLFGTDMAQGSFTDRLTKVREGVDRAMFDSEPFIILDISAPAPQHMRAWWDLARRYNYKVMTMLANTSWRADVSECIKRAPRTPPDMIRKMSEELVYLA